LTFAGLHPSSAFPVFKSVDILPTCPPPSQGASMDAVAQASSPGPYDGLPP